MHSVQALDSDVYIRRHKRLDVTSHASHLVTWSVKDIDMLSLADENFQGEENLIKHLKDMDSTR